MFGQLALSTAMVLATVAIHGVGLAIMIRLLGLERHEEFVEHLSPMSLRGTAFTLAIVVGLFVLHGVEIWAYAALYHGVGALPDFHTALYFSTITYATIGYDDHGIDAAWQLVAAIEGINGVILLGWSTAFFVSFMNRLRLHR